MSMQFNDATVTSSWKCGRTNRERNITFEWKKQTGWRLTFSNRFTLMNSTGATWTWLKNSVVLKVGGSIPTKKCPKQKRRSFSWCTHLKGSCPRTVQWKHCFKVEKLQYNKGRFLLIKINMISVLQECGLSWVTKFTHIKYDKHHTRQTKHKKQLFWSTNSWFGF